MKPAKGGVSPKQSCSCSSCLYRSESDRPSLRKIIAQGSKIDKLYYGKYIPLRERKLLDKLVRTRAVYDDIRTQLLSGSSISIGHADLKPRKNTPRKKPNKDTQKGGDIPALVDLVDKGNVVLPENSSECCSCCICGSDLNMQDERSQTHIHKHKRRAGGHMTSKSSVMSRDKAVEETKLRKAVHFKTKHIRSDPCACTYKLREMMKRHSKSVMKKLRKDKPEPVLEPLAGAPEHTKPTKRKIIKKSIEKVKQSKTRLVKGVQEGTRKSVTKIKDTKTKVKENVEAVAKKSLEKMQETKQKIQEKIESTKHKPEPITLAIEETTEEKPFKIRKDSLTKFREKLKKKCDMYDWECDLECLPGECFPEECFKIVKRKRLRKLKDKYQRRESASTERRGKQIGDKPKVSEISIQAQTTKKTTKPSKQAVGKTDTVKTKKLDMSCVCVEIKKKDVKHTKDRGTVPSKSPIETKPKISLTRKPSKGSPRAVPAESSKEETKIPKESLSGLKVENVKSSNEIEKKVTEGQIPQKARQAVGVSSSFSFNIEFYKDRPILGTSEMKTRQEIRSIIKERQQQPKSKDGHSHPAKARKRDKGSETTLDQSVKNVQATGHPLKRCFCTLKLKPRKTKTLNADKSTNKKCLCRYTPPGIVKTETESVTESIQTNKTPEESYVLEPYECEPICIPGECDPIECEKRIRKRNKKRRSVSIYTKKQMKSSSSITAKSASSTMSRGFQAQPIQKTMTPPQKQPAVAMSIAPATERLSPHRQAVRIGSTFSFQIEFSKDSGSRVLSPPTDLKTEQIVVQKPRRERGVPKAKRYIRHKYSQISSSTKTKFTTQKHKLRRCFCTLKLNKTEKKKKVTSTSKGTITSGLSEANVPEPKLTVKTVAMATKKIRKRKVIVEPQLLPYECEPGVCTPGDCDPYACLELIKRREIKEFRSKANTANTQYRKTKSTSSFAPKTVLRSRTKKVQSTFMAYKAKAPSSLPSETKPRPRPPLESPHNLNKQVVRIGSSFSFNVEFYKDNSVKNIPVAKVYEPPKSSVKQEKKPASFKQRGSQMANATQQKSVFMQAVTKQKNVPIGPAMKRCFCTLKLRKPAKEPKKDVNTVGTKTQKFKIKQPIFSELEPYECEPYVCTPGECDPHECLERIKKRNAKLKSKEIGMITKPSRMKSTSSSAQNFRSGIKDAYAQSKRVEQQIITKNVQQDKHIAKPEQTPKMKKMDIGKQPRQSVRLGSNFSFDIEFHKDRKSDESNIVQVPRERGDVKDYKVIKNQGAQPLTAMMRQHESQVNVIKKVHRGTGVAPILKRCFCTLQLQKKRKHPIKAPQVYTVSRVGVTKPTFIQKQFAAEKVDSVMNSVLPASTNRIAASEDSEISSCNVLSCSTLRFNSHFMISSSHSYNKYAHSVTGPVCSQPLFRRNSVYLKNDNNNVKLPRAVRSLCMKNPPPTRHIRKKSELSLLKYYESYTSKIRQHPNEMSAYLKRQFCAMNIQVDKYGYKLKPYECEPGVCVPYECDPLVCQERIMKRLRRHASKSSGTRNPKQSTSSTTLNARHRSKRLQSNASVAPSRRSQIQSPSTVGQKISYPGSLKQAVRVGSNFSFNIEFSKDKMQPTNVVKEPIYYPPPRRQKTTTKKIRHKGTRDHQRSQMDRESQSSAKMAHRGSGAKPLLKRCFCTLKLHKKGGQEKAISSTDDKEVTANNDVVAIPTVDSTQNTDPLKYRKLRHHLEPYECEPGICVPGECDPYKCLELIKKRKLRNKDFGTDMKLGKMSTASMTPSQKRKMKNRCNQLKCKEKTRRVQKYEHSVQSLDYKPSAHVKQQPSRQAVRIGSSFSFNVEFFKENPNLQARPSVTPKTVRYKPDKEIRKPRRTHDFKERFSQDSRSMRHKDSQSDSMQHKKSTMTDSFMKRCFCTAKLHKKERTESHSQDKAMNVNVEQQSPSLLQRCLCVMKSLTAAKFKTGTPSQTEQESAPKSSYNPPSHHLEPYECEPGVCIPGECDPYVCEQLIKKRNAKVCTKETCTARMRTRSQSSRIQSYKSPRTKQTQMTVDTSSKVVRPTSSGEIETRKPVERSGSPGRQAVRIGSNFSFNIEFYKDRPSTEIIQDKPLVDHQPRRRRTSDDFQRHRPKTTSRGSLQRGKHRHNRDSQVQARKTQDRASGVGRLLQRCFCTLNLRKPKVEKRYSESGTQSKRTAVVKESPNIETKGIMTVNKATRHKLEPYECEPNTCIPGQCDPYECEKRIKRRLRREYGTSTGQFKTKSATSMASSAPKLRHTKIQSTSKKTRRSRTATERIHTPKYIRTDERPASPSRQAVRIGSTFSFNVEFFKEHGNEPNVRTIPEPKITYKDVGDIRPKHRRRSSVPCNTKTCQARTRMREVDSQVLAKKMRSTMSGVTPFLKRCFCTLKLQKAAARAQQENQNVQTQPQVVPIMTGNKSTFTSKKLNKSRPQPPVHSQHLDPYECEPGVCIPGECDPYECEKRIKMRDIRRHSVSSNTDRSQDASKYVSATAGRRAKKSHATSSSYARQKQKVTMSDIPRPVLRQAELRPTSSPHRQAVRIGSNFSFDIEFYKDKSGSGPSKETYPQTISYKPERPTRIRESSKSKTRNTGAGYRGISFYHRKSQATGPKTETKGSGMKPFLKRCFCTLKLQKQGKRQEQPSVALQADYTPPPSSFDASTGTKKQRHVLEPYECEPNVCVPGFCDPYECLRRIKNRQMKESGVATVGPSMKSDYSLTSRKTTRDQCLKTKCFQENKPQRMVSFDREPQIKTPRPTIVNDTPNRQAVRIGSSFKFDIEFYKQSSTPNDQGDGDRQTYEPPPPREYKQRPRQLKTRGSQGKCAPRCQGVQIESAPRQSRGSGMAPLLKRCFCTLALQNTPKQPVAQMQTQPIEEVKTKDICTQSRCKFNKSKSLPYTLDPYECEPNVCVPGECDPYECYERIKRRNARFKSKGLGTDTKRYSQVSSMTTDNGKFSKRTQSALLGKRRHHRSSSANESMVVEKPRLQLLSDIAHRNVVRIGSNVSFNIEFYKELAPAAAEISYSSRRRDSGPTIDTRQKHTYKTTRHRSRDSQAQTPKYQNKGSLVSNALKRCFCTAQLHKPNVHSSEANKKCDVCKPKSMFRQQQYQVFYHRASLEKKPTKRCISTICDDNMSKYTNANESIFRPQVYQVYHSKPSIKKNPTKRCVCTSCENTMCKNTKATTTKSKRGIKLNRRSTTKSKKIQNANEMETILPYAPNKFNKKASKTLVVKNNKKGNVAEESGYCEKMKCPKLKKYTISKNRQLKKSKSTKKFKVSKSKKIESGGQDAITSTASNSNIKSFLCRCKQLFSNKKNVNKDGTKICVDICPLCKSDKTKNDPVLSGAEKLKKTKSERRPTKTSKKEPKKSKSLKIKNDNQTTNEETRQDYSQFQSGDTKNKKVKPKAANKRKSNILSENYETNRLHCGDDYLYLYVPDLNQKLMKDNKKQVKFSDPNNEVITAEANLTPQSTRKDKLPKKRKVKRGPAKLHPMKANCQKDSYLDIVLQPSYLSGTQFEGMASVSFKGENKLSQKLATQKKSTIKTQSLQADDTPCPPGICRKKGTYVGDDGRLRQPGASISIPPRGSKKSAAGGKYDIDQIIDTLTKNINAIKKAKSRVLNTFITKEQICSCYSSVCECAKAIREEKQKAQKLEMEIERDKRTFKENEKRRKEEEKEEKQKYKEFLARLKKYDREDTARKQKRLKEDKLLTDRLKHAKTSDVILAAESILDIAKLGCTVVGNVARSTGRFITDPAYTCRKMKTAAKDPVRSVKNIVGDTGLFATLKRVFLRVTAMQGVKAVKSKLEENEFTGYLMQMADEDPKKRMQRKKKKAGKKKEPDIDDFECSLYMSSLRRKRFLSVYYLCPWFYPHFITLLNVVEQVTDLLLFVLAVFVWSPCILCMELCRAFVCCFLCTG